MRLLHLLWDVNYLESQHSFEHWIKVWKIIHSVSTWQQNVNGLG